MSSRTEGGVVRGDWNRKVRESRTQQVKSLKEALRHRRGDRHRVLLSLSPPSKKVRVDLGGSTGNPKTSVVREPMLHAGQPLGTVLSVYPLLLKNREKKTCAEEGVTFGSKRVRKQWASPGGVTCVGVEQKHILRYTLGS